MKKVDTIGNWEDKRFRNRITGDFYTIGAGLEERYIQIAQEKTKRDANSYLLDYEKNLKRHDLVLTASSSDIRDFCEAKAKESARLIREFAGDQTIMLDRLSDLVWRYGMELPQSDYGIDPVLERLKDSKWWRRQVNKVRKTEVEQFSINRGVVHKKGQIYCSDWLLSQRKRQKDKNKKILQSMEAVNNEGDAFTLDELAEKSVANPKVRRSELMVRIKGFEMVANRRGHAAEFYTLTCPSKYHPKSKKYGKDGNEKFTPRQANEYLCSCWARARAELHRKGINVYGFRVVEPHHDGCPHWHLLLFMRPGDVGGCRSVLKNHVLHEERSEPGASKHRFTYVSIDPERGTAAGYIAKYIAKNIDGEFSEQGYQAADEHGNDARDSARRVEAWASGHRLRQFQQIGGPSVSVWRELRRIDPKGEEFDLLGDVIQKAVAAADASDWAAFVEVMGGTSIPRAERPLQLYKEFEFCRATGVMEENIYGEPKPEQVRGLKVGNKPIVTRIYQWTVRSIKKLGESLSEAGPGAHGLIPRASPNAFGAPAPLDSCQ